jgi:hypothetical protein
MLKSMNLVEQNYGIPDKEALAIIKGLQNWRHWLERTQLPVQILMDHKNLEYFMCDVCSPKASLLQGKWGNGRDRGLLS